MTRRGPSSKLLHAYGLTWRSILDRLLRFIGCVPDRLRLWSNVQRNETKVSYPEDAAAPMNCSGMQSLADGGNTAKTKSGDQHLASGTRNQSRRASHDDARLCA